MRDQNIDRITTELLRLRKIVDRMHGLVNELEDVPLMPPGYDSYQARPVDRTIRHMRETLDGNTRAAAAAPSKPPSPTNPASPDRP